MFAIARVSIMMLDPDTCRVALMSQADSNGNVITPTFVTSWQAMMDQVGALRNCFVPGVGGQRPQGGFISFKRMPSIAILFLPG